MSARRFDALTRHRLETVSRHARHFYDKGWLPATAGNFSIRLPADTSAAFVVSATGRHKSALAVDASDRCWSRRLADGRAAAPDEPAGSSDTAIHSVLFRRNPRIGAIYHAHLVDSTATGRLASHTTTSSPEAPQTLEFGWSDTIKAFGDWCEWRRGESAYVVVAPNGDAAETADWIDRWQPETDTPTLPGLHVDGHGLYVWGDSPSQARRHLEAFGYLYELHLATHARGER
jgi:methylthioribulose-1-phosphate dehydratase